LTGDLKNPYQSPTVERDKQIQLRRCHSLWRNILRFLCPWLVFTIYELFLEYQFPFGEPYSFFCPEMIVLGFLLGVLSSAPKLRFAYYFMGILSAAYFYSCFSISWIFVATPCSFLMSISPWVADRIGELAMKRLQNKTKGSNKNKALGATNESATEETEVGPLRG